MGSPRKLLWLGDSLKTLRDLPEDVKDSIGYALHLIQEGHTPSNAKQLKGFKPAVMEIVTDHNSNTYRTIYTVKIGKNIYVLHCFQKKSKSGIKTPKQDIESIKSRLNEAMLIEKYKFEGT
jgi:phage-related protein